MTSPVITTGIDQIVAETLPGGQYLIRFRSTNAGMHHQLYLNGNLSAWTDSSDERSFLLASPAAPASCCIVAVEEQYRQQDLSNYLPEDLQKPSWVYHARVIRSAPICSDEVVEILDDRATGGDLWENPLISRQLWPEWQPRWAFGQDRFGEGGFGYDGANALGFGNGAFAAGMFGIDTDLIELQATLTEQGRHKIVIQRRRTTTGQTVQSEPIHINVDLPPAPAKQIMATNYDFQKKQLTLQITP